MQNSWMTCLLIGLVGCGSVKNEDVTDAGPNADSSTADMAALECPSDCALGCNTDEGRCHHVNPSNGLAGALDDAAGAADLVLVGDATIDTDAGTITDSTGSKTPVTQTVTAGLPVPVFVVVAKSITTDTVTVTGTRALALVAEGAVTINGRISVDAREDIPGPGALDEAGCRGGNSAQGTNGSPGAGGGGFGSVGGRGGRGGSPSVLGASGGAVAGTVELVPLRGGCSGGHPGGRVQDANPTASDPGGGGGAIQVVSNTSITLGPGGFITSNGGGGQGSDGLVACASGSPCGDGEGGGSGGAILLEAPSVVMDAASGLTANGGGGSCSVTGDGAPGQPNARPALGDRCSADTGDGGNGAAASIAAEDGEDGANDDPVGGGGGGGVGRIRVNLPNGAQLEPTGVVSPPSSVGILGTR